MTAQNRATLYNYFLTNAKPTQAQFANLIDSSLNLIDSASQSIASTVTFSSGNIVIPGASSGAVTIFSPAIAGSTSFVLPANNGTSGYFLQTDGLGNTSWVASATSNPLTLGANGGTGGSITLNGATTGSCTIKVDAASGTNTIFKLPTSNGTNAQILSTDGSGNTSWITSSSTAAEILLNSQNLAGALSVAFSATYITNTYNRYFIRINGLYLSSGAANLLMTFSTNNGSSYLGSNYHWNFSYTSSAGAPTTGGGSGSDSSIQVAEFYTSTSTLPSSVVIEFTNLATAVQAAVFFHASVPQGVNTTPFIGGAGNTTTTAINNIQLAPSTGTFGGGVAELYGVL